MSALQDTKPSPPEARGCLLVVDDNSAVREVLAIKLAREHYEILEAEDARQALILIEAGGIDLILLDIHLPDMSGLDLLKQVRISHSLLDLPVIMISGQGDTEGIVGALRHGANDFVTKPFDLAEVTARIRTQLTIRQLKQANDHFLRTASHDLKKPLLMMVDMARQLRSENRPGARITDDMAETLKMLVESGEYMRFIIEDLLELRAVRDGRIHLTRVLTDLGAMVRQVVVRNTNYAASKEINIAMQFGQNLVPISVDDARLTQVLENLVGNAIKFCPPGSVVTISTGREDGWLRCAVSDNGPGIPPDELNRLFMEYARLSNRPTGGETSTGLGLAICKELIVLHGGEIGAYNNPDGGVTFWLRLPLDP